VRMSHVSLDNQKWKSRPPIQDDMLDHFPLIALLSACGGLTGRAMASCVAAAAGGLTTQSNGHPRYARTPLRSPR
jgi:hypothetical protein